MKRYLPALVIFFFIGLLSLILEPNTYSFIFALVGVFTTVIILYIPSVWVEDGFAAISYKLKISALITGAFFMAASSSAPEFFTAFSGVVLYKIFDIGIITILWSALFNLCVIISACSFYKNPLTINHKILKRDLPFYGVAILLLALLGLDNYYSKWDFIILITNYLVYIGFLRLDVTKSYQIKNNISWFKIIRKISIGILLIGIFSHVLVTLGLRIITISESLFNYIFPVSLISIIIFAPGTSITDVFMSISATKKGEDSSAIANAIGSNIFDITICLGIPDFIYTLLQGKSIEINFSELIIHFIFVFIGFILVYQFAYANKKIFKWQGTILGLYFITSVIIQTIILL